MSGKAFGSGYFGEWITDEFGLPAYRYTCNQITDPKAKTATNEQWRLSTDHSHQVGNDRLVAVVSNYGHVQVRQDEGSPKFLNDYVPDNLQFAGGFGYLTDGKSVLSTCYSGEEESFDRVFGVGYYRKTVKGYGLCADQIVFAPFGDDPLLISQVKIENNRNESVDLRWIEYWGCQQYQFSMKSFVKATIAKIHPTLLRRELARQYSHTVSAINEKGMLDVTQFTGEPFGDRVKWRLLRFLLHFVGKEITGGPIKFPVKEAVLEDLSPPPIFLVSLDAPYTGFSSNASAFFGEGRVNAPDGIQTPLSDLPSTSEDSERGLFLERKIRLEPGESKILYFAFGYTTTGHTLENLVRKYETNPSDLLSASCNKWKQNRIQLDTDDEKWVDRELLWHNYYLRSNLTFDSFFREHILSQGHIYQYLIGFQGAARDPLQHVMPFVYSEPSIVKNVLRYTLKSVLPDGEIPYGVVGSGMKMPAPFRPSDLEMWLLWSASEYVLATRDLDFLEEKIPTYPLYGRKAGESTIGNLLKRCYHHFVDVIGTGKHGLQRLSNGDWNDTMVVGYVPEELRDEVEEVGESVLNAAMASYTLNIYGRLLEYTGDESLANDVYHRAEAQRKAVSQQWVGKWFKRSWLNEELGWVGEDNIWLEPQPWAIIGGAADSKQRKILVQTIDELVRKPQKNGAMILGKPDEKMEGDDGVSTNAGVWPSINGTLIWALSLVDGKLGWDEWKKNTLAYHGDCYPEIWYGIWSGPDTYNSEISKYPGGTIVTGLHETDRVDTVMRAKAQDDESTIGDVMQVNWTDFPVMNMHPHAWPQYSLTKLMGIEFNPYGIDITPTLPKNKYRFTTPLLEIEREPSSFRGRYSPISGGVWKISLKLQDVDTDSITKLIVNGVDSEYTIEEGAIVFSGESSMNKPLEWKLEF
ncbi:MAG: GH36-type glycosyl hydrolase domain-containing protein [Candidatus Thorarchaeota archaeon]